MWINVQDCNVAFGMCTKWEKEEEGSIRSNDVEKQLDRIVVVQPVESKKVSGVHSITMEQEDDKTTV